MCESRCHELEETGELVELAVGRRGGGGLLQHPLLPHEPPGSAMACSWATSARSMRSTAATSRLAALRHRHNCGSWPNRGELRAVSDIGTHWMDLGLSITGLEVDSVFADLNTVHKVRKRPTGEVETFTGKKAAPAPPSRSISPPTTTVASCSASRTAPGAVSTSPRSTPAARTRSLRDRRLQVLGGIQRETPNELWIGYRDKPNKPSRVIPPCWPICRALHHQLSWSHNEGVPDAFKQCFRSF